MSKLLLSLALVFTLSTGIVVFSADHQSSGSSNSGSSSQNSGTSSTDQNSATTNQGTATSNQGTAVDDQTLTSNVNQAFASDKVFSVSGLLVSTKSGKVTIRGSLSSQME